jgi:methylenetetrahydrofolate reductase (NADPH)
MAHLLSTSPMAVEPGRRRALVEVLRRARFEILPLEGAVEAAVAHVPTHVKLTVTASPARGLEATIEVARQLLEHGYEVAPHLSARLVRDAGHLREVLDRLEAAGVRDLFVIAGDAPEPAGSFEGAADLIAAMGDQRRRFADIGISGYPESHHLISDDATIEAMTTKAAMATYIVSQITFDARVIAGWIDRVRARGTLLPIWIGVPGSVDQRRLLRTSMRIGLGESARFLRTHRGWLRLALRRRFTPTALVEDLASTMARPDARVGGLHVYTFNELQATERWRRGLLERLGEG